MRIAFTGHRPNRLRIGEAKVAARIGETLASLLAMARDANPAEPMIAISALAEGADRLFAAAALDRGMELHAYLPFPVDDYLTTFADAATTPVFHTLLARASAVKILPGSLTGSSAGYEAVGRAMVDASDAVVAVWDGKPSAGRGGTTEIIDYALASGREVVWIDAEHDRPARRHFRS